MTNHFLARAGLVFAISFIASGCSETVISPSNGIRIEPIAAIENGIARWDPNDDSTLYMHAIGIPDEELDRMMDKR
jgi:hypothetical protein